MKIKAFVLILLVCVMCFQVAALADDNKPYFCSGSVIFNEKNSMYSCGVTGDISDRYEIGDKEILSYYETYAEYIISEHFPGYNVFYVLNHTTRLDNGKSIYYCDFFITLEDVDYSEVYYINGSGGRIGAYFSSYDNRRIEGYCCSSYLNSTGSSIVFYYTPNITGTYGCGAYPNNDLFETEIISADIKCYLDFPVLNMSPEQAVQYMLENDIKASNEADFLPKRYGVIEPPQNLKLTYTGQILNTSDAKFTWTQSDERYRSWTTEIMIHGNVGYKLTVDLFGDFNETGTLLLKTDTIPTSDFLYKINFGDLLEECRAVYYPIVVDKYGDWLSCHLQLREGSISFRNRYSDGEYTYYSNWVKVYADEDHNNCTVEYEYNDPVYGDENFDYTHDAPIGNINPDSPYQDIDIITDVSLGNLSSWISNGFGLSGEGGIIDMFSDLFSFIPSAVWTLILTGISVLIVIALLKAVF